MILKYNFFICIFLASFRHSAAEETPLVTARVFGWVFEKGTRKPLQHANVQASFAGLSYHAVSQENGSFVLHLPEGLVDVQVHLPGYASVATQWHVKEYGVHTQAVYMQPSPSDTYVVESKGYKSFIQPTVLDRHALSNVAGTQGDPFKVITTMPGVGTLMPLLPYAMVRGTSPDSTGFFIDNVRVPQLFHMFAGPAVIHPQWIEKIDFFPGHYPAQYGGYIGGVVSGVSKKTIADKATVEIDADLTKTGVFVGSKIPGVQAYGTVAARYGYPYAMLSLTSTGVSASFWDYQARVDVGKERRLKLFIFGSSDDLKTHSNAFMGWRMHSDFHRAHMSYQHGSETLYGVYDVVWGVDTFKSFPGPVEIRTVSVEPHLRWHWKLYKDITLQAGINMSHAWYRKTVLEETEPLPLSMHRVGAYVETRHVFEKKLTLVPSLRTDAYVTDNKVFYAADPKIAARLKAGTLWGGDVWFKSSVSYVHQPPRFSVPVVGVNPFLLQQGLTRSFQVSAGVEIPLPWDMTLHTQAYYWKAKPLLLDVPYAQSLESLLTPSSLPSTNGRSMGVETWLKKDWGSRMYGWLAYTWSLSQRSSALGWRLFAYHRAHVFKGVLGLRLPYGWDVSCSAQYQSPSPVSKASYRVDLRMDKKWIFTSWMMDFYVDVINVTYAAEDFSMMEGYPNTRYMLPTVGLRVYL